MHEIPMPESFDDKDIEEQLELKWLMLKNLDDDSFLQAHVLTQIEALHQEHGIALPEEQQKHLDDAKKRLQKALRALLVRKKQQLERLQQSRRLH